MKRFGNTVVAWDLHSRKPKKVLDVPGAPVGDPTRTDPDSTHENRGEF